MIVPVEDADDAEEADEESSSTRSSVNRSVSSSSSSSASSKGIGGGVGKPASFALAKDLCRSLMICDGAVKGYHRDLIASRESPFRREIGQKREIGTRGC